MTEKEAKTYLANVLGCDTHRFNVVVYENRVDFCMGDHGRSDSCDWDSLPLPASPQLIGNPD